LADIDFLPSSFSDLNVENVQSWQQSLADLWGASAPTLDVHRGVVSALVVRPSATLCEVARYVLNQYQTNSNFESLLNNPDEANSELLDFIASGYYITRKHGTKSSGVVRLYFQTDKSIGYGLTYRLTANGIEFQPRNAVTFYYSAYSNALKENEVRLRPTQDGTGRYYGDLIYDAMTEGSAGNLVIGAELDSSEVSIEGLDRAIALGNFVGGSDSESNQSLIQRMLYGASVKSLGSRMNMKAYLLETFPDVQDSVVIGSGDMEMTRDKHRLIPFSSGSYADWYVRTTAQLQTATILLNEGDWIQESANKYRFTLDSSRIVCPYRVTDVLDSDSGLPCRIESQYLSSDYPIKEKIKNEIVDDIEGIYSAYSHITVTFTTDTPPKQIRVNVYYSPGIDDIQTWVNQDDVRPIGQDILIKGVIPAITTFSATVYVPTLNSIDDTSLRIRVADRINRVKLGGDLAPSMIVSELHNNLPAGSYVTGSVLMASVLLPTGEDVVVRSSGEPLEISVEPYVSQRTVAWFGSVDRILLNYIPTGGIQ